MQGEQPLAFGFVPEAQFPEGEEIPDGLQSLPDAANLRALVAPFLRKYQSAQTQTD
jgi:hypothetical protein